MIVKTPSPWHVLATQISAAQTPSSLFFKGIQSYKTHQDFA